MLLPRGRPARVAAVVVTVLTAYAAGVVTGTTAAPAPATAGPVGSPGGVLDSAANRISATAEHPVSRAELDGAALRAMVGVLDDRWSAYYAPADFARFQAALDGYYSGVGLWLGRSPDGRLRVTSVESRSPAARAGVLDGDEVVSVAGRSVTHRAVADVVADLRGVPGTELSLVVRRGTAQRSVTLRRATFAYGDVTVAPAGRGVVRIRVAAFSRGVGRHVRAAVASARAHHAAGVVLDLRGDPGGLLDEAVETASAFLDGGPVVSYQRRAEPRRELAAMGRGDITTPLIVLVDGGTASAAEVVAAALQDRNRAVIVGARTFGKGSVQEPTRLADGSALELTVGRYLTPRGRSLDGVGLEPDIEIRRGSDPRLAERRAVEVLAGLLANAGTGDRG